MAENTQFPESENTLPSSSPATGKSQGGKKAKAAKATHVKTTVRLLVDHDHALRLASVLLERAEDPIHTIQAMVDDALSRYTAYLEVKKGIDFQGILPKKPVPSK